MKKIFITGADGFIGSHLTEHLLSKGFNVTAMVYYNSFNSLGWLNDISNKFHKRLKIISGDLRDKSFLISSTKKHDVIIHLAALIAIPFSYEAPESYVQTNIIGTLNVLDATKINKIKKIIVTSTSEIYGRSKKFPISENFGVDPRSPYSATKISADQLSISYYYSFGIPVTILRPFNTVGPRQSPRAVLPTIINQIIDDKRKIKIGNISTKRNFNSVYDIVRGFECAIKTKKNISGEIINLGSSFEISIKDLLKMVSKIEGKRIITINEKKRVRPLKSEIFRLTASNKKAKRLLNWSPKIKTKKGFEKFVKQTIIWFKNNRHLFNKDSEKYSL